jgi:hypothetical protein
VESLVRTVRTSRESDGNLRTPVIVLTLSHCPFRCRGKDNDDDDGE